MENYVYKLKGGIKPSPKFQQKGLAEFAVNVGLRCGHDCTYCSSRAMLRCHKAHQALGTNAFATGYFIVDPEIPEKVATDAKRKQKRGMVQLCTMVDAWAPEAQELHLGRRCLEAILAEPGWTVRILTKNAAVVEDFDLIRKHKDRVLVGLSLTGTPDKEGVLAVVEPHASPISERMSALQKATKLGLRTYGMLCPLLPGIADESEQIDDLVRFVKSCGAEEVFSEAVNPRGNSLTLTERVLRENGFFLAAQAIAVIRNKGAWSAYTANLVRNIQKAMGRHMTVEKVRVLLYPAGLTDQDQKAIRKADSGVIWL